MSQVITQNPALSTIRTLRPYLATLNEVAQLQPELAVREVASVLSRLVREQVFSITDLLDGVAPPPRTLPDPNADQRLVKTTPDPFVAARHDGGAESYALQVFVWPAGSSSYIHDHSC